ncbi:hypothetical protein BH09BAC6_BH09BAC6_31970 [soil metagenome]|jgi:hypothetical protein
MSKINIKHIKHLNNEYLRGLDFYLQELGFLQERLEEVAKGNTGAEASEGIEHFQNQLIIHRDYIEELRHLIHANNKRMEEQLQQTWVFVDEKTADEHQALNEQYLIEEKMFNEMRHEFNRFAAKWL